jgi:GNAT superfamily N-acetyltransferase
VEDNPAGRATLFIALKEDVVVGMQSLIPYVFIQDGELVHTFKSEDTLVEKKLRGHGIFSKLYEMVHAYAGDTLVWGMTDKKEILEHVKMPSSERLTIAISVKRPSLIFDKKGFHRFVAKTLLYSVLYVKSAFKSEKKLPVMPMKELNAADYGSADLEVFFDIMSDRNPHILYPRMNLDYLKWRLTDNPNLEEGKIFVSCKDDGAIVICSIVGYEGNSAYWQSFYALDTVQPDEKIAHVVALRKKIFDSGVQLIHTWLFECNPEVKAVKEIFYRAGFSKVREGLWIVHNSTDKNMDVHNLYFSPQLGIR